MTQEPPPITEDTPVKLNPDGSLPAGDQVAARCEAGVLGMFVGGLIFELWVGKEEHHTLLFLC